nr:leucine-rich repeat extensin-like protein 5 [Penaeus vannamei]
MGVNGAIKRVSERPLASTCISSTHQHSLAPTTTIPTPIYTHQHSRAPPTTHQHRLHPQHPPSPTSTHYLPSSPPPPNTHSLHHHLLAPSSPYQHPPASTHPTPTPPAPLQHHLHPPAGAAAAATLADHLARPGQEATRWPQPEDKPVPASQRPLTSIVRLAAEINYAD